MQQRPDRTLGPGHDEFWAWCEREELRFPKCSNCGQTCWPISPICDGCGDNRFDWVRVSGRGTLISWCRFERDYYRGTFDLPWDTILVQLEDGPLFISNPDGFGYNDMAYGMAVQVNFLACKDGAGKFNLPVFTKG